MLIGISLLLYKTFASFKETTEFPIVNGKVDYFGNSDVYFAFYKGDELLDEMPTKDNPKNLEFAYGECDNGANVEWDENEWAPLVKNLSKSKTKCTLYFGDKTLKLNRDVPIVTNGDGLYTVTHEVSTISNEWNKTEYRYAGSNPNNYVKFNNEIWRIIGLVNVKTDSGIEQRIKIIRTDGIEGQKDFGTYSFDTKQFGQGSSENNDGSSDWTDSQLKDMLNGIFYESQIGNCYKDGTNTASQCDFTGNGDLPKGLDDTARNMIDSDVIWNTGWYNNEGNPTPSEIYEQERSDMALENYDASVEWSKENDIGNKHNGIALIYPSDYGYAVGGDKRESCLNYTDYCSYNNWLYNKENNQYTLTPMNTYAMVLIISGDMMYQLYDPTSGVYLTFPTAYLRSNVKIKYDSSENYGSLENPFELSV